MRNATLCLLVRKNEVSSEDEICLGDKKRKLGKGKPNGFGGMQEPGESVDEAAVRELFEEARVRAVRYQKVGEMTYRFREKPEWDQIVNIFLVTEWEGTPTETEEMGIAWYRYDQIPYDRMWENDRHWLPHVLSGKKIKGYAIHSEERLLEKKIEIVDSFPPNP